MVSQTRSQAVRQSLHLLISPSYTYSKVTVVPQTPNSAALSIKADKASAPPSPQIPDPVMFSVLCQYDFDAQESGMLSFRKGEILDVVKRDDTGWWAAMPKGGTVVGWIPQAFVHPLSNEMAEKLRNLDEEFRIPEFEAEELYNSSQTYESGAHVFDSDSDSPTSTYEDFFKSHSTSTVATSHHSKDTLQIVDENTLLSISQSSSSSSSSRPRRHLHPPPSPTSPMPVPPAGVSRSVSLDKPTPPTPPPETGSKTRKGSLSNRHIRRRPVMVNDNPTLRQLSTLIETKDLKKIDEIASPDITGSFDAIFKRAREEKLQRKTSQTIKQTKKNHTPTISLSKPRYLKPLYADQIDEDEKGHIRFASMPALIERLTTETGKTDLTKQAESSAFTNVFLTTFRTFTTADQLFELLVDRFNLKPPKSLTDTEYKDWKTNLREPVRRRILEVFNLWLAKHRLLDEEPHVAQRLSSFLSTLNTAHAETTNKLIKEVERLTFTVPVGSLSPITPKKARKSKAHKNDLLKLDPVDIAEQLALWEFSLYVKITPQECLSYAKTKTGPKVVHLLDFCATHDKLGAWVKKSILKHDILSKRADTVEFWIKVAEKCRSLNNFASMSAIIIALSSMVIKNLHLTWSHVHRKSHLDQLLRHSEPTGGFAGYRILAQNAEGPCVPFIGMYLTDIVHAQDQHKRGDGRICFFQKARWYEIITNMLKFQSRAYSIVASESTMLFIETNLGDVKDENWYWTRSQDLQQYEMAHADIRKGLEAAGF